MVSYTSRDKVPYLREPHAVEVAWTQTNGGNMELGQFLSHLGSEDMYPGLDDYFDTLEANKAQPEAVEISDAEVVTQLAGQLCYLSFTKKRTELKDNKAYVERILKAAHGSVLEHASASFLLYGIDRATTHELIRHRAGMAYSQVSQRYVDGTNLRFVMPFEYQGNKRLERLFERDIENAKKKYERRTMILSETFPKVEKESATDFRKRVQSCSRECLPNSTEAPIMITGNMRAWRHVIAMRCSPHADIRIRRPMIAVARQLKDHFKNIFQDFEFKTLDDASEIVTCTYPKV